MRTHRLTLASDLIALTFAAATAGAIAELAGRSVDLKIWAATTAIMSLAWVFIAYASGLYRMSERRVHIDFVDEIGPVSVGATAWIWCFVLVWAALVPNGWNLLMPAMLWVCLILYVMLARAMTRSLIQRKGWNRHAIAIIGETDDVLTVLHRTRRHPEWGLEPELLILVNEAGNYRVQQIERNSDLEPEGSTVLKEGTPAEVAKVVADAGLTRAVLAGGLSDLTSTTEMIRELIENQCLVDYVSGGAETLYSTAALHHLEGLPVLSVGPTEPGPMAALAKRGIDVVGSLAALLIASPILAWAAIRIKLDSPGPVFFKQQRPGLNGEPFTIIKLRTMVEGAERQHDQLREETAEERSGEILFKLKEDPRVTGFGELLRRTSLDELPQFWNVLRGDMSLVGPRPVLFEETAMVDERYAARSRMKPGIVGLWQVMGRSDIPFEDMVRLDYTYVVGWSLSEDLRLMLRTATAVTRRNGAY